MGEVSPKQIKSLKHVKSSSGSPLQPSKDSYKSAMVQAQQDNKIKEILKKNLEKNSKQKKGQELFETKKVTKKTESMASTQGIHSQGETIIEIAPEFNDFPNKKDSEPKETGLVQTNKKSQAKKRHHHKHHVKSEEEQDKENVQLDSLFLTIEEKLTEKDPELVKARKAIKDTKV
jgi:hypothetical protein